MRIVYFGTAEFAVPTLERLIATPDVEVVAAVTQPDRPQGRGNRLTPPPVKVLAQAHGIPIFQPERLRRSPETLDALDATGADFFVVAAYGQILPQRVLDMPRKAPVNVHGSLLPRYRGAAPVQWAIYHGETETGVTTMRMEAGLDTGPMLLKATVPITPETTAPELMTTLAQVGAGLLIQTLFEFDSIVPEPQDDAQSSYAPLISKEQHQVDWQRSARQIRNQIRAFYPYAFTTHRGERLRLLTTEVGEEKTVPIEEPATVVQLIKSKGIEVATGDGTLLVTQVQPAGGKALPAWDYANGYRLTPGERLDR